ncbi:MAG: proton-conducting transporter membrane subunit [Spirochaetia bacterium]|jgi:hydrogenase-4 component F|nr:proton-conducting transporter membrane subunit [Spirochaetia bacterium]
MAVILIVFPIAAALIALIYPWNGSRPVLLPLSGVLHSVITVIVLLRPEYRNYSSWFVLDPPAAIILLTVSILYLLSSFYAVGYLRYRPDRSNRVFTASFSAFLGLISMAIWSHNLGLMWVAIEGTVLVTAPLIYFNHSPRSIEATWKYLLVGSVGIAMALLGTLFLAYSLVQGGKEPSLDLITLSSNAAFMSPLWLRSAFILFLVGYGTKMGLAPMHTWKPDAYGEAPGVVGAIFSGGVTSGAFLALLRIYQITNAAGQGAFTSRLMIFIGLFSMATAGIFMINQRDFKRMLAYSSVEHMGIITLGVGIGGIALWGALLHVIMNAMTKGVLFLSAANIHRAFKYKSTDLVQGAFSRIPLSAGLFLAGFFAITGAPPFGPFVSEFTILNGAFLSGRFLSGSLYLIFLLAVFIGMGITVLKVVQGKPPEDADNSDFNESILTTLPVILFLVIVVFLGVYLPPFLRDMLSQAVEFLGNAI